MIGRFVPLKLRARLRYITVTALHWGMRFACPCCGGRFARFQPFGVKPRPNARCPRCLCLERHRLLCLYLKERTGFLQQQLLVLDVAPLEFLQQRWRRLPNLRYVSADRWSHNAMIHSDLTDMPFHDSRFDCILCYHVLEHVPDDRSAMQELFRIVKPGGWAILQSPVDTTRQTTDEDPSLSPNERAVRFGQHDHVRSYGLDYKDRLEDAGWLVTVDDYVRTLRDDVIKKFAVTRTEDVYFCSKPGRADSPPPGNVGNHLDDL